MEDLIVRPSSKIVMMYYILAGIVMVAGIVLVYLAMPDHQSLWIGAIPGILLEFGAVARHLSILTEKITISSERLRYESGFISKSTHTIDLAKVQDVRVDQSVRQRLLGMGLIAVETSGGASSIVVNNIDNPHKVADMILDRSRHSPHHQP